MSEPRHNNGKVKQQQEERKAGVWLVVVVNS